MSIEALGSKSKNVIRKERKKPDNGTLKSERRNRARKGRKKNESQVGNSTKQDIESDRGRKASKEGNKEEEERKGRRRLNLETAKRRDMEVTYPF